MPYTALVSCQLSVVSSADPILCFTNRALASIKSNSSFLLSAFNFPLKGYSYTYGSAAKFSIAGSP